MYFFGDVQPGEVDILADVKHENLLIKVENGSNVEVDAPETGWTNDLLYESFESLNLDRTDNGIIEAYLGGELIGSTEC
jgi:hypothetical protein